MLGAGAIYRSITAAGAGWARLGFYVLIVGTTLWSVHMSMQAATARAAGDGFGDGVAAIEVMSHQVHAMAVLVEWLAISFLGIGMLRSAVYPKWQGWTGLILGILTFALGGVPLFFLGEASPAAILSAVLAGLTTIWALIIGSGLPGEPGSGSVCAWKPCHIAPQVRAERGRADERHLASVRNPGPTRCCLMVRKLQSYGRAGA